MSRKPPLLTKVAPPTDLASVRAEKRLTPGDRARIEHAVPRLWRKARSIHATFPWMPANELFSVAALKLTIIAPDFDPAVHPDFEAFYYLPVRGAMFDLLRRDGRDRKLLAMYEADQRHGIVMEDDRDDTASFFSSASSAESDRANLKQYLRRRAASLLLATHYAAEKEAQAANPERTLAYREALACLAAEVEALPEREQKLVRLLYSEELTLDEVAAETDDSSRTVRRVHAAVRAKLEAALSARGINQLPEAP